MDYKVKQRSEKSISDQKYSNSIFIICMSALESIVLANRNTCDKNYS